MPFKTPSNVEDGKAIRWTELKREIAIGVEEADRGELIDGDVVFQQLRARLEQRRNLANS